MVREVEELRKQEIIDLKEAIHKVEQAFEGEKEYGYWKQIWLALTGKTKFAIRKAAVIELEKTRQRVEEISNNYPKVKKFSNYWNKIEEYINGRKEALKEKFEVESHRPLWFGF